MVIVVKTNLKDQAVKNLVEWVEAKNISVKATEGENSTILGLIGDTTQVDIDAVKSFDVVQDVFRVQEPYKQASRKFKPTDTVVEVGGVRIGGGNFQVIAGPCSVESETQILDIANRVHRSGARLLRGGAFKPRTSPYAFQGLQAGGIELLKKAKAKTGMPIVSEIMSIEHLPLFQDVDIIQVGARNMQNFELLKALGKIDKAILLKRGLSSTIDELLMSAEYILAGGNARVILCERGIRTFETATRNTLDISAVAVLKKRTHLPVVIDPSHSGGYSEYVESLSMAATAIGADGLIVEVHNDPKNALCDGAQSLTCEAFDVLMQKVNPLRTFVGKLNVENAAGDSEFLNDVLASVERPKNRKGICAVCSGVAGGYSHAAAKQLFDKVDFKDTFADVFEAVESGAYPYGVVPIENTVAGSVVEVYDLLSKFGLHIVDETVLKIQHCLLAKEKLPLSAVKRVYSHPQALYQCREFLSRLGVETVEMTNTAKAAQQVAESSNRGDCAIAAGCNAKNYALVKIADNIAGSERNYTRFITLSRDMEVCERADKTTMLITLQHKQNSLLNLLTLLSNENINMLKLESRPIVGSPFEMMFFIAIEGSIENENVKRMLQKVGNVTDNVKVLGSYCRAGIE